MTQRKMFSVSRRNANIQSARLLCDTAIPTIAQVCASYPWKTFILLCLRLLNFFFSSSFSRKTEKTTTYDPRVDMIQNDDDPSCRDEFPNCSMVLKSKLCGYAYYNENCCQSCRLISNELF